jgi:hypothetical protein
MWEANDFTDANLAGSIVDEIVDLGGLFCNTMMPNGSVDNRDCP